MIHWAKNLIERVPPNVHEAEHPAGYLLKALRWNAASPLDSKRKATRPLSVSTHHMGPAY